MTDACPTWPTLLAWIENDLPDEEAQLRNTHVVSCEECRERLALMNAVHDVGEIGQWDFPRQVNYGVGLFLGPLTKPDG